MIKFAIAILFEKFSPSKYSTWNIHFAIDNKVNVAHSTSSHDISHPIAVSFITFFRCVKKKRTLSRRLSKIFQTIRWKIWPPHSTLLFCFERIRSRSGCRVSQSRISNYETKARLTGDLELSFILSRLVKTTITTKNEFYSVQKIRTAFSFYFCIHKRR